jgi:D-alanyl-D-alanine carboxypeptidase/D-alanyl-D-alanine-endopeptidase (penicillin-binding protein 4)
MVARMAFHIRSLAAAPWYRSNERGKMAPMRNALILGLTALLGMTGVVAAKGPADARLRATIDALLTDKSIAGGRIGVLVERTRGGAPVYVRNANERMHPASNNKVITTAVALSLLGPAHRWRTDLSTDHYDDGVARNLYLIGRGDPRFVSESLWNMVEDARIGGLRKITGDIIVDDTWFTADRMAPGFDDKDQDSAYRAATGAMSLNFNSVSIQILPAKKAGSPPHVIPRPDSGFLDIKVTATTSSRGRAKLRVSARKHKDRTRVTVGGRIPVSHAGIITRKRIDNPPLYAGFALVHALKRAGIETKGRIRLGAAPPKKRRLARHWSPPLGSVVADVNKLSNNFMAEHLVRTLGRRAGAGDWRSGTKVVSQFLREEVGIKGFKYVNGSGLFGDAAFSARDLVEVLRYMGKRNPPLPEFPASLSIGGTDGTLRRRLKGAALGAVRAKTGTLDGVICLSGYLVFADGTPGVFSILMNDIPGRPWKVWALQDQIVSALLAHAPGR